MAMHQASFGAFDITLHDLKTLWGLDGTHTGKIPGKATLDSALRGNPAYHAPENQVPGPPLELLPGFRVVLRRQEVGLDLGGIAKGYIVDRLHLLLDSLGAPDHIVQAGGDIRIGGRKPSGDWNVGIRHPRQEDSLAGTLVSKQSFSVSTAGDYERYFIQDGVRYHHIFDPRTGIPVPGVAGVTVLAATSMAADAIDDALFVLGPDRGAALAQAFGVSVVWFLETPHGLCAVVSPGMESRLSLNGVPLCPGNNAKATSRARNSGRP
jgi:thiamine biosynthesis lipoprotein